MFIRQRLFLDGGEGDFRGSLGQGLLVPRRGVQTEMLPLAQGALSIIGIKVKDGYPYLS